MTTVNDDLARCMALAEPLLPTLHKCWHDAMDIYAKEYPPHILAEHDDTTAANSIRAHLWIRVKQALDGKNECVAMTVRQLNVLIYQDKIVWRFKKVDEQGLHANYQTLQQQDYDLRRSLPGIPPAAVRLTSGYQPDVTGLAIERHIIARPFGRSIQWAAQVNLIDDQATWTDITPQRLSGTEAFDRRNRDADK